MSDLRYLCRYFRVVPPIPALITLSFVVITVISAFSVIVTDAARAAPIIPVLVLQAFSASTGFSAPARRGYFDLLLARGESRVRIATVQWLTAIAPGLASWAALACVQMLRHGAVQTGLLASGTLIAMLMASTVPWAVTVALPRFSGAIGWLLVVTLVASGGPVWPDSVREILFPIDLLGERVGHRLEVWGCALLVSFGSAALALWWVHRTDIRLESAQ